MIFRTFFIIFTLCIFSGCANKDVQPNLTEYSQNDDFEDFEDEFKTTAGSDFDPLSGYNRVMTKFNDAAMRNVITPVAKGYQKVVPKDARNSLGNFFSNLLYPVRLANNLLQGKFSNALDETNRFLINTTVGFLGFADVAGDIYKIEEHNEDFGQTLGVWDVPPGPHIVLPILGPSNLRDFTGSFADSWASPMVYMDSRGVNLVNTYFEAISVNVVDAINEQAQNPEAYETLTKDAIDLYPLLKSAYEQRREALIKE
ncbi:MAG: VacJ family lipoprotein [Campylobacteraceae bacterium]